MPINRDRRAFTDAFLLEVVISRVPVPVPPTQHEFEHRLFYGQRGERLVGYDNERARGDHRHRAGLEERYAFRSIAQVFDDLEADVVALRGTPI